MLTNWAGNLSYGASRIERPSSLEAVQEIVSSSERVKALGTRHSFSDIADTSGVFVSTEHLNRVLSIERGSVLIEPGITYGALAGVLCGHGLALHNLASLPHISVAGACATATHGSGDQNGCLSTAVLGMEIVGADAKARWVDDMPSMAVHLGAFGIVTKLRLRVGHAFQIAQAVYRDLPLELLFENFDAATGSGYSVSFFTDWRSETINQVWVKSKGAPPEDLFGSKPQIGDLHPIPGMPVENCTPQAGVAGRWDERLPHFRMEFTPSSGDELQSEYLLPRDNAIEALKQVWSLHELIAPLLHVSEIRTIAADDLWTSPFHQRPSVGIHFTWKSDWKAVQQLLPPLEERLLHLGARPHWGKLSSIAPEVIATSYPKFQEFAQLVREWDPVGKFRGPYLERLLGHLA